VFSIAKTKCCGFITIFKNYFQFTLKQLRETNKAFWNSLTLSKPENSLKKMPI